MSRSRLLLSLCLLLLVGSSAQAALTGNYAITPQVPTRGILQFLQGTDVAGTYKTLYTAGVNGSKCFSIWSTNNDASATHLITIQVVNAGVKYGGTSVTTTLNQGFISTAAPLGIMVANVWGGLPTDSDGNSFIYLASGDTLQATFATALTAAAVINLGAACADF